MEKDTLQTKIDEAKALLSKESRGAIDSVNWKLIISGMSNKYNQDQLENLETETELLLCGLLNPEDYPKELETRMQISKEEVALLIGEMDKLIFKKIQEDLEKRLVIKEQTINENKPINLPVLDSRFSGLPKQVQSAIAESNWREKLYSIAPKYKLNIEQMGSLEEITVKVMLNTIHSNSYESELASKITIAKEDISNIVKEVDEEIFKKIRQTEMSGGLIKKEESASVQDGLIIKNENTKEKPIINKEGIINNEENEEEIPLPPYGVIKNEEKKIINNGRENTNIIKNNVEDILKKIEPVKPVEPVISVVQKPEQNQTTPASPQPSSFPKSIIEEKLMNPTVSESTTTDYSTPKKTDPYREAF